MPTRTCLGCRTREEQHLLVRLSAHDGEVIVQPGRDRNGRGAYLHPDQRCLDQAIKRRAIPRALRASVDTAKLSEYLGWS